MRRVSGSAPRPGIPCLLICLAAALVGGCGDGVVGGGDGKRFAESAADGESPKPFVKHFQRITGVRLKPVGGDLFGTRLEVPAKPNRFERFGAYSMVWTRDDRKRKLFLGREEPDEDGIYWRRVGSSYSGSKPFGDRLVLRWVGRQRKETTEQWDRLERAVDASLKGALGPLLAEERPCRDQDLDPLEGETGACALNGLPVKFVAGDEDLETDVLEARVLGYGYAKELRNPGVAPLRPKKGRFLIVAYRVENKSDAPIGFIQPDLRIGGRRLPESPDAAALLPRSGALPLPPGATVEARAGFDIGEDIDPRKAAIALPAERDGRKEPSPFLSQGWIRLEDAPARLPKAPGRGRSRKAAARTAAG